MARWWQGMDLAGWATESVEQVATFRFAQAVAAYRANHRVRRQTVRKVGASWVIADAPVVAEPCS